MSWLNATRTRLRLLFSLRAAESRMDDEIRLHIEMETERLLREAKLDPGEARRRAFATFGGVEKHREALRDGRGMAWLSGARLDFKLGLRMLVKYPGLSAVAVIGMSVAIAIGAGAFGALTSFMDPTLPLDDDERIIAIQNSVVTEPGQDRQTMQDFLLWREELTTVEDLGAFTTVYRNMAVPGKHVELVSVAQMTASGFRLARVAPVLGRPLIDDDEREGAPPVIVIAHEEWQRRFDADPGILGKLVHLGGEVHTVVGVMPEGFRFPLSHRYWAPLRLRTADREPGSGPTLIIFGRLTAGATIERAQAEIAPIGSRMAQTYPRTHDHLRPTVLRYAHHFLGVDSLERIWTLRAFQTMVSLLLVVVAVNVAILVYARTATRSGEIAVRTALGASRRRIVTQLFAEALVLSGTAAAIGLAIVQVGFAKLNDDMQAIGVEVPFWLSLGLSNTLLLYVLALAMVGAVIVGVLPALQATGRRVQAGLQQLSTRGSQMQLGRTWTALIIAQVAVAVAILPFAMNMGTKAAGRGTMKAGYATEEFLRASLSLEREELPADTAAYERALEARFQERAALLLRRLEAEPAVSGVAFARYFPGSGDRQRIEIEGADGALDWAWTNRVDTDVFTVFDIPVLAGRNFAEADTREGSNAIIVDRIFAEQVLDGVDVLGTRVRYVYRTGNAASAEIEAGPWLEIVGVVPEFTIPFDGPQPKIYEPVVLSELSTGVNLAVRVRKSPASAFAGQLREVTAAVDPTLQLHELRSAADALQLSQRNMRYLAWGTVVVTLSVLLLSAAGIYAMMAFTVARRRREIGIRVALGAPARHVLSGIFARATIQLALGVVAGLLLAAVFDISSASDLLDGKALVLLPAVAAVMLAVGLLAALGPARQGLAVQPSEALRAE